MMTLRVNSFQFATSPLVWVCGCVCVTHEHFAPPVHNNISRHRCAFQRKGSTVGHAQSIGRVGALAIALGVAAALATPAISYGAPTDSSGSSSSSSSGSSSSSSSGPSSSSSGSSSRPDSRGDSSSESAVQTSSSTPEGSASDTDPSSISSPSRAAPSLDAPSPPTSTVGSARSGSHRERTSHRGDPEIIDDLDDIDDLSDVSDFGDAGEAENGGAVDDLDGLDDVDAFGEIADVDESGDLEELENLGEVEQVEDLDVADAPSSAIPAEAVVQTDEDALELDDVDATGAADDAGPGEVVPLENEMLAPSRNGLLAADRDSANASPTRAPAQTDRPDSQPVDELSEISSPSPGAAETTLLSIVSVATQAAADTALISAATSSEDPRPGTTSPPAEVADDTGDSGDDQSRMAEVASTVVDWALDPLVGGSLPGAPASPSPAMWLMAAAARKEVGLGQPAPQPSASAVVEPTSLVERVVEQFLTPASIFNTLEDAFYRVTRDFRNFIFTRFFNRTPVASEQQIFNVIAPTDPIQFFATDADGDGLTFIVNEQNQPGGPRYGTVEVNNELGTFQYIPGPEFAETGFDTFTYVVEDEGLHVHLWRDFLNGAFGLFGTGLNGGHRDVAVISVFAGSPEETATITDQFTVASYNIADLPDPLSSAPTPRLQSTVEITNRLNQNYETITVQTNVDGTIETRERVNAGFDIVQVQEDFALHYLTIENTLFRFLFPEKVETLFADVTPAFPPVWAWPIGVPVSDGLNTFSQYKINELERVGWNGCRASGGNCLTEKGYSFTELQLPGGETVHVYNAHLNTGGGEFTNADIQQLSNEIQRRSVGKAVVVTGDFNTHYDSDVDANTLALLAFGEDNGLTDAWALQIYGQDTAAGEFDPSAVTIDNCDLQTRCQQLDHVFFRSASPTVAGQPDSSPLILNLLQEDENDPDSAYTGYYNWAPEFTDEQSGEQLSDHRPVSATLVYTTRRNDAPTPI